MAIVTQLRHEIGRLLAGGRGYVLVPIAVGWGLLVGTRMIYPVLLPNLREWYHLDLATGGLLLTVIWLATALGQLPGGMLSDRFAERSVMATGTLLAAVALAAVVLAPNVLALFLATALFGLGLSLYPVARITLLTETYPDRLGSALGVTMATGDLGQSLLPPIAALLAALVAWQLGFAFLIPLLLLIAVGLHLALPTTRPGRAGSPGLARERVRLALGEITTPSLLFMTVLLFLYIFIWQTFTAFYPTYLAEVKGIDPVIAGIVFGGFFAVGVVVKPLAGTAYDRMGVRRSLMIVLSGPVVGLFALPFIEGLAAIVAVTALVSTMLGTGAITQSYLSEAFAADMRGTGLGVVRAIAATLGSFGPVLFGVIADRGLFDEGYLALSAIMAVIVLLTVRMPE